MGSSEDAELVNSRTRLQAALEEREEYWHDRPADAKRRAARRLTRVIAHRASTKDVPTWLLTRRRNLQQDHELDLGESFLQGEGQGDAQDRRLWPARCLSL